MNKEEKQLGLVMSCSDMYIARVNVIDIVQSEYSFYARNLHPSRMKLNEIDLS
jgi:hypothetical protein